MVSQILSQILVFGEWLHLSDVCYLAGYCESLALLRPAYTIYNLKAEKMGFELRDATRKDIQINKVCLKKWSKLTCRKLQDYMTL